MFILAPVEKCYNRMRQRNRNAETTVTREYLKSIHEKHCLLKTELANEGVELLSTDSSATIMDFFIFLSNNLGINDFSLLGQNYKTFLELHSLENFFE